MSNTRSVFSFKKFIAKFQIQRVQSINLYNLTYKMIWNFIYLLYKYINIIQTYK